MTVHAASRVILASRQALFDLVADVERYPDFLPLWREARVVSRNNHTYFTEQEIGVGRVHERFRTRTTLYPPARIEVTSDDPLFDHFYLRWDFDPAGSGCRVAVAMSWQVSSKALQTVIDRWLPSAARTIVTAFERRARELLGA